MHYISGECAITVPTNQQQYQQKTGAGDCILVVLIAV